LLATLSVIGIRVDAKPFYLPPEDQIPGRRACSAAHFSLESR